MKPGLFSFLEKVAKDLLPGGKADNKKPSDFSPTQLRKGVKVELEHTNNRRFAKEISMDHLSEDPVYYSKLETIHKEAGVKIRPKDQEFLDEHFSISPAWKDFKKKLRAKGFVEAVKNDPRADSKLKRYSEANGKHLREKNVPTYPVPSQSSGKTYNVKYHPDIDRFSCNCGDWVHARSHKTSKPQQDCKHVWLVKHELKMSGMKKQAFANAINSLRGR